MRSKIGLHIHNIPGDRYDDYLTFMAEAQPGYILNLSANAPWLTTALSLSPLTIPIQRKHFEPGAQLLENPQAEAAGLSSSLIASSLYPVMADHNGYWVGYNEIAGHDKQKRQRLNEFDYWMAFYAHRAGMKYACLSASVGRYHVDLNRDDPLYEWEDLYPAMREADAISWHGYNAPRVNDPRDFDQGWWWRIRRPELVRSMLPEDLLSKPWICTEGIIDSGASGGPGGWDAGGNGGWQSFMSPAEQLVDIQWFDEWMQSQPWMLGGLLFGWGTLDPTWETFRHDTGEMYHLLLNYMKERNSSVDLDSPEFQAWLAEEAQKHVTPYNPATLFRSIQAAEGWDEALSDEFYPRPGVVAQVFLSRADTMQHIVYAEVGKWDQYRVITRPN